MLMATFNSPVGYECVYIYANKLHGFFPVIKQKIQFIMLELNFKNVVLMFKLFSLIF